MPPLDGDKRTSISALSSKDLVSNPLPSVFHISYSPPASSPSDLDGGPSIETTDLPDSLCPVMILLIVFPLKHIQFYGKRITN